MQFPFLCPAFITITHAFRSPSNFQQKRAYIKALHPYWLYPHPIFCSSVLSICRVNYLGIQLPSNARSSRTILQFTYFHYITHPCPISLPASPSLCIVCTFFPSQIHVHRFSSCSSSIFSFKSPNTLRLVRHRFYCFVISLRNPMHTYPIVFLQPGAYGLAMLPTACGALLY
jgi:hypothetical protein